MHEKKEENVELDVLEEMGYERSDVPVEALRKPTAIFFGGSILCFLIAWGFVAVVDRSMVVTPTDAEIERKVSPPEGTPILQSNITAKKDMVQLRAIEREKATKLEINPENPNVATIPIDDAMRIVTERGLPSRPSAPASSSPTQTQVQAPTAAPAAAQTTLTQGEMP
ncbi:MAG: hypothetical protein MUC92_09845 [Fimbriimonadaceae bacterium]|jgi:hypothetical protein|nr:hypothetical protein [Fimbriimonadaceae bacterium]